MPIGRPLNLTANVASKSVSITATAEQTEFSPAGGYRIDQIAVYRNGTRLVNGEDFTARDGATVTLISAATIGDTLEFQIFDSFNVANTINTDSSDQTINGSLTVTNGITGATIGIQSAGTVIGAGKTINFIGAGNTVIEQGDGVIDVSISGEIAGIDTSTTSDFTNINVSGITTAKGRIDIGASGVGGTISPGGNVIFTGITTIGTGLSFADDIKAKFGAGGDLVLYHDGSNSYIKDLGTGDLKIQGASDVVIEDTSGSNSAVFNTDGSVELYYRGASAGKKFETTTSGVIITGVTTSSSFVGNLTGNASGTAGGLTGTPDITVRNVTGVAATFTGVLTYEDVTNVDSVGIVTARSGFEIGAAGVGGTITAVGNAQFTGIVTATSFSGDGSSLSGIESWNQQDTWLYGG